MATCCVNRRAPDDRSPEKGHSLSFNRGTDLNFAMSSWGTKYLGLLMFVQACSLQREVEWHLTSQAVWLLGLRSGTCRIAICVHVHLIYIYIYIYMYVCAPTCVHIICTFQCLGLTQLRVVCRYANLQCNMPGIVCPACFGIPKRLVSMFKPYAAGSSCSTLKKIAWQPGAFCHDGALARHSQTALQRARASNCKIASARD